MNSFSDISWATLQKADLELKHTVVCNCYVVKKTLNMPEFLQQTEIILPLSENPNSS